MLHLINLGLLIDKKIEGLQITNTDFGKQETLLDADIVLINPEAAKELWNSRIRQFEQFTPSKKEVTGKVAAAVIEKRRNELEILTEKKE